MTEVTEPSTAGSIFNRFTAFDGGARRQGMTRFTWRGTHDGEFLGVLATGCVSRVSLINMRVQLHLGLCVRAGSNCRTPVIMPPHWIDRVMSRLENQLVDCS
jgi:hypothetical protein